ncbi:putative Seipin family protein [Helianthus anomalus]
METLTISHRPLLPSLRRTSVRSGVSSTRRSVTLLHLSLPLLNLQPHQVRVDFLSSDGNVLASTRQPCMLRFKSQPIRHVSTFWKLAYVLEKRA